MGGSNCSEMDYFKEFLIPDYIFDLHPAKKSDFYFPKCPVVVFINSKSGGQQGTALLETYRRLLNKSQVLLAFLFGVTYSLHMNLGLIFFF